MIFHLWWVYLSVLWCCFVCQECSLGGDCVDLFWWECMMQVVFWQGCYHPWGMWCLEFVFSCCFYQVGYQFLQPCFVVGVFGSKFFGVSIMLGCSFPKPLERLCSQAQFLLEDLILLSKKIVTSFTLSIFHLLYVHLSC